MKKTTTIAWLFVFVLFGLAAAHAQALKPASLFGDDMVLQRGMPVPIWGAAGPNQKVTVKFAGQVVSTKSGADGRWNVELEPLQASKRPRDLHIIGDKALLISNVVVGEVWICSGQSNMQFPVGNVPELKALLPTAENIRSFEVKRTVSFEEADDVTGTWADVSPESAVAFGFAYFLEQAGDVPVGIIHASWGSSSLEAWMPRDMAKEFPYFHDIMEDFDADIETREKINVSLASPEGWLREEDIFMRRQPNILYNAMMKPLAPYACRGLVWYQGERNTRYMSGVPKVNDTNWFHKVIGMREYGDVLKSWVNRYRKEWKNKKMHFAIVMLPGYGKGTENHPEIDSKSPAAPSWAWMRESQLKVLDLQHTSVANTIDLGDEKDIHPKDKLPIGKRLALLAGKYTLNNDIIAEGPMFDKAQSRDKALIVHFRNANGLKTIDGKAPLGFWITDGSLGWKPADAKIVGETVVLTHSEMTSPLYVRYAFAGKPDVNLVNGANLPAYPFRTDKETPPKD